MATSSWIGALMIVVVLAAPGRAQTSQYPYYQIRDLEQSILANMQEEAEDMQEIYDTLKWVPVYAAGAAVGGGIIASLKEWIEIIHECHNATEATNIIAKINRVLYLQQAIPQQIGTLRNLSAADAQSLLNSRSYTSLQKKIRQLELMSPASPPTSCSKNRSAAAAKCEWYLKDAKYFENEAAHIGWTAPLRNGYARAQCEYNACMANGGDHVKATRACGIPLNPNCVSEAQCR